MKSKELISNHLYEISTCFTTKLFISLEQSYDFLKEFLTKLLIIFSLLEEKYKIYIYITT
jgi:hypothetical protein